MNPTPTIPQWILVVSGLLCALALFVGVSLYVSPGTFIPEVDFNATGVRSLTDMWAARQVAIAVIIGFAALRKSVPMLQIALTAYCVMNIQDALIGVSSKDLGLVVGANLFGALSGLMVAKLRKTA